MSKLRTFTKANKRITIKGQMFSYTFAIMFLISVLSIYSLRITNIYKDKIDEMFERNILLKEVNDGLEVIDKELLVYLSTKDSNSLNNYMKNVAHIRILLDEMLVENVAYTEEELMIIDIKNMMSNYMAMGDQAIDDKRKSMVTSYSNNYKEATRIKSYIELYINDLNIRQFGRNANNYIHMTNQINTLNILNVVLLFDLLMLSIIIVLKMSGSIITPIIKLSYFAEEVAKGKFEIEDILVDSNDEIEILANAFNKMKLSIHDYIESLKEKSMTEAMLMDQEIENLKMQSLLDEARLYALQSQMNPHFLFNTINAGVQLSMIEGADRTSEFLEAMSRLFRYNIKQLDQGVTVSKEVENIKDYYELLKVRFGDLIKFEFVIDGDGLDYLMPPLTLQPIVENSYIHGLAPKEDGGYIKITIHNEGAYLMIVVEDNGVGMSDKTIEDIFARSKTKSKSSEAIKKNTSGIGMANVIERLELYYKEKDLIHVNSTEGLGTKVIMSLPLKKEI